MQIILAIVIFLSFLQYLVFFDVILSWLIILWINFRPKFISDILNPVYITIKKVIPTSIWPIDFTPIVIILLCWFIQLTLYGLFPEAEIEIRNLLK